MPDTALTPLTREHMVKFREWLLHLHEPLTPRSFIYCRGNLAADRGHILWVAGRPEYIVHPETDAIGKLAWASCQNGRIVLVQHKLGSNDFQYIAIRSDAYARRTQQKS